MSATKALQPKKRAGTIKSEAPREKSKKRKKEETTEKRSNDSGYPSSSFSELKKTPEEKEPDVSMMNIAQLLALGEGHGNEEGFVSGADSNSDWEEVKEEVKLKEPVIPKEGVDITVEAPNMMMKKKRKGFDMEGHVRRQLNRVRKELQVLVHKVHVLCWIAHVKSVNKVLNSHSIMGVALSLITNNNLYPPKHADLTYLERILKWFNKTITLSETVKDTKCDGGLTNELVYQFEKHTAYSKKHLVYMFIVMMRVLGVKARLVVSFLTVPLKPKEAGKEKDKKENTQNSKFVKEEIKVEKQENTVIKNESKSVKTNKNTKIKEEAKTSTKTENTPVKKETPQKEKSKPINKSKAAKSTKNEKVQNQTSQKPETSSYFNTPEQQKRNSKKTTEDPKALSRPSRSTRSATLKSKRTVDHSSDEEVESKHFKTSQVKFKNETNEKVVESKTRTRAEKKSNLDKDAAKSQALNPKPVKNNKGKSNLKGKTSTPKPKKNSSDSDSEFTPESIKRKPGKKIDRRVLSSDEEVDLPKKRQGVDVWSEVFLEAEEKWISVDVPRQKIHCVKEIYSKATQPVVYVIACNTDSTLKDVTKRYVPHWHSDTRKKRVDEEWWEQTIWPYLPAKNAQDREEDEDIARQLEDMPLPTVIGEYKDHPLYALKRHLLKFEGIYPPEAPTLGFVRGEPVYARECVVTLRSREIWFKEARVVRAKETPYKIVKSRPKFDKMTGEFRKDLPLEVFGVWQTEDYDPPTAVDGKVPRNEYGNVDLFKPCMLPKRCVYLQVPGLIRVAKKLNIDCAPAVVGFDFHSGGSHPILDGFVVCEEFKEVLLEAWNKDVDETAKRNEEKREKRVYGNWRRLIRGLLIREKLKLRYAFGEESDEESKSEQPTASKTKVKKLKT